MTNEPMNFFKRRKLLKHANYLEMIPIRKIQHKFQSDSPTHQLTNSPTHQLVTLLLPKFKSNNLFTFLFPHLRSAFISIHLDEFGSAAWLMIDGKINVEIICRQLQERFPEKLKSPEEQVTKFLTKLYDNRYITYKQLLENYTL
jgi:hypothetical protein